MYLQQPPAKKSEKRQKLKGLRA